MSVRLSEDLLGLIFGCLFFVACVRLCNNLFGTHSPRNFLTRISPSEESYPATSASSSVRNVSNLEETFTVRADILNDSVRETDNFRIFHLSFTVTAGRAQIGRNPHRQERTGRDSARSPASVLRGARPDIRNASGCDAGCRDQDAGPIAIEKFCSTKYHANIHSVYRR